MSKKYEKFDLSIESWIQVPQMGHLEQKEKVCSHQKNWLLITVYISEFPARDCVFSIL